MFLERGIELAELLRMSYFNDLSFSCSLDGTIESKAVSPDVKCVHGGYLLEAAGGRHGRIFLA